MPFRPKTGHLIKGGMCQHRFVLSAVTGNRRRYECCRDAGLGVIVAGSMARLCQASDQDRLDRT